MLVCICSRRYPARNALAPYCHLWPAPLCRIFPHYLINYTIFEGKKVTEHKMCVVIFSTTFVCKISHSKKNWARCDNKMYVGLQVQCRYYCAILMEPEFSRQVFEKCSNIKFHEIRPVGVELFHADGQTDRHGEANSGFSQCCERAWTYVRKLTTMWHCTVQCSVQEQLSKTQGLLIIRTLQVPTDLLTSQQWCNIRRMDKTAKNSDCDTADVKAVREYTNCTSMIRYCCVLM